MTYDLTSIFEGRVGGGGGGGGHQNSDKTAAMYYICSYFQLIVINLPVNMVPY